MNKFRVAVLVGCIFAGIVLVQGCALLVVGAVAGGAAYGTVSYVGNELRVTAETGFERGWSAANGALKDVQMPVVSSKKDALYGKLESKNAKDQSVFIEVFHRTDRVTEVRVRVGTFDTKANRADAQFIYDKIKVRF